MEELVADRIRQKRLFWQAVLIALVCGALYFVARSPALDEWDSVQFALGVGDYNLWRHHPHPPGYPLYEAAGWALTHAFSLDVTTALELASALGGGLFVACWFVLAGRQFGTRVAWPLAAGTATLLIVWMSATKVLTDPLAAGFLALTLVLADGSRRAASGQARPAEWDEDGEEGWPLSGLAGAAVAGAAAVGVRPQNAGVVLLILCVALAGCRGVPVRTRWWVTLAVFFAANLAWLIPTLWLQAHTPEAAGSWFAYPRQLFAQWQWRFDQPKAFIGASPATGDPTANESIWRYRLEHHPLGWFTRGFGFAFNTVWGWAGCALLVLGWIFYARDRRRAEAWRGNLHRAFWLQHLPWATLLVATVFCFLPGDQRYYLPIFPLLILPSVLGWATIGPARLALSPGWLLPVITLATTAPFIRQNHEEAAPPVRLAHWLTDQYPAEDRHRVWLYLRDSRRHFEWYAPLFHIVELGEIPTPKQLGHALAIYTDDPAYGDAAPGVGDGPHHWLLAETFRRSPLIYRKHNTAALYLLVRDVSPPN